MLQSEILRAEDLKIQYPGIKEKLGKLIDSADSHLSLRSLLDTEIKEIIKTANSVILNIPRLSTREDCVPIEMVIFFLYVIYRFFFRLF